MDGPVLRLARREPLQLGAAMRSSRFMGWGLPLAALLGTGAAAAARLPDATGLPTRPIPVASPGRPSCARGPETVAEFAQTPEGYLRFPFAERPDYREFFFARAIYSDGGGRGGFGFGFGGRRGGWGL